MAAADMASAAQSLLALYGALDQAVISTGDPEIEALVERYLPGSTGANAGWYDELLGFLDRSNDGVPGGPRSIVPDLGEALTVLQGQGPPAAQSRRIADSSVAVADEPGSAQLTPVQLSRMAYAIGALSHLPSYYPPQQWDAEFAATLAPAGPGSGVELLDVLRHDFGGRADWTQVMLSGSLDADVAAVPLCNAKPKWVRGRLCVVLTTEFTSETVSLDDLKGVIDPLNWARCLPFFCAMDPMKIRPDGWSRVLEHFSTVCAIPGMQMLTPLKYWKGQGTGQPVPEPTAWVDYMLDDDPAPGEHGDGAMVVDEGFIRMTSTVGDPTLHGVQVRTRKVVGFRDLGWFPTALFACVLGYADQGIEMLLGGVAKRAQEGPAGWTAWQLSTQITGQSGSAPPPDPTQPAPAPPDPTQHAVTVAIEMLNECIDEMSQRSAALAAKWAGGTPPVEESIAFAADLTARLATDPWRYLQRLCTPPKGGGT